MKILFVTEFFPTGKDLRFSGGVEARTFFIARNLSKKHKITVITSRGIKDPKIEKMFGFTVYKVGPKRDYAASVGHLVSRVLFIKEAIKVGKTLDVDIIDGGNYISHLIAKQIANHKKIPVAAWYPDVWLNDWIKNAGVYGIFGEILERYNMRSNFDAYIAISNQTAQKLKRYTRKKVQIIYCGVDQKEFAISPQKFRFPTIICVSRLTKYKNIKTLILAFSHLSIKVKTARLIIIGTGPEEKKLKNLAKELKIFTKVIFLKNLPRKELIKLYKKSHVFSLPSIVEGFGIATIEAAAAGLPYVNSSTYIHKEVTKNGFGGFLVNPSNYLDFSDRLYQLLTNKKLYEQKSEDAAKLSENYNWSEISQQTEKIYYSFLRKYED